MTTVDTRAGEEPKDKDRDAEEASGTGSKTLMKIVSDPDPKSDPAAEILEKGEPFEGNHA